MIFHVTYHHGNILKITFSTPDFLWVNSFSCYCNKHWPHFYLLNTALYNHIYTSIFVHMENIFSPKTILKPNTSLFESLPLFSSEIFCFVLFICSLILLSGTCTFRKLRPSVCIFNLTSASGEISVIISLQVNNFFHFLGNLNNYHLPGKYPFPYPRNLFPLLGNLNCYQVNTIFNFQGTRFHFLGNLNYYLLQGKYHVPLPGN